MSEWKLYIIETQQGALYTGITTDVSRRWSEHLATAQGNGNKGAKFFRVHVPKSIVHTETFSSRSLATKRELEIKKMSALEKKQLIAN